jgi:hypothetical protein
MILITESWPSGDWPGQGTAELDPGVPAELPAQTRSKSFPEHLVASWYIFIFPIEYTRRPAAAVEAGHRRGRWPPPPQPPPPPPAAILAIRYTGRSKRSPPPPHPYPNHTHIQATTGPL